MGGEEEEKKEEEEEEGGGGGGCVKYIWSAWNVHLKIFENDHFQAFMRTFHCDTY